METHMKSERLNRLPESITWTLKTARDRRGWSQAELGKRAGLPQAHISGIESGRVVPRFDTLLDLVRILGFDLVLVPQAIVPAVQALARDTARNGDEQPLYADDVDDDQPEIR